MISRNYCVGDEQLRYISGTYIASSDIVVWLTFVRCTKFSERTRNTGFVAAALRKADS